MKSLNGNAFNSLKVVFFFACVVKVAGHVGSYLGLVCGPVVFRLPHLWLSLALTSMFLKDRFLLKAIIGGLGNSLLSLCFICSSFQLFFRVFLISGNFVKSKVTGRCFPIQTNGNTLSC